MLQILAIFFTISMSSWYYIWPTVWYYTVIWCFWFMCRHYKAGVFETKAVPSPMSSNIQRIIRYLARMRQGFSIGTIPCLHICPYGHMIPGVLVVSSNATINAIQSLTTQSNTALKSQYHQKLWSWYKSLKYVAELDRVCFLPSLCHYWDTFDQILNIAL